MSTGTFCTEDHVAFDGAPDQWTRDANWYESR